MRFFNKHFSIGLGSGVVLTITLIFLAGYVLVKIRSVSDRGETRSKPPDFSSYQQAAVYEQAGSWSIRTLEGKEVPFSQFKGKVVFLNFWATWCPPCVAEMPSIQNLYDSLKDDDIAFVLIADENKRTVRNFMKKNRFTFPVYVQGKNLPDLFNTRRIPATYILDRKGIVVFNHVGSAKWDDEACLRFFRSLM
ncbi:MAG: TlpA family protein disulfide reductase [Desulfobacterales bacterium]|nr:TlpA family protein disulfide reductase [Desulfobacterales bacterium]